MPAPLRCFPVLGTLVLCLSAARAEDLYPKDGHGAVRSATPAPEDASDLAALRRWAARDRVAALTWLESQKPPPRFALAAVVEGWSAVDAAAAASYLAACPDETWQGGVVDALALDAMAERRPRTALALLARFPGSAQEALLRETALAVLAELDPLASARPHDFEALLFPRAPESPETANAVIALADFARLAGEGRAVVIDVRSEIEHREARVPGALHWPAHDFEGAWLRHRTELASERSRPIIVYCADGGCGASGAVWRELRRLGYARTTVFPDGWAGWLEAGSPIEVGAAADGLNTRARAGRCPGPQSRGR